MTTHAAPLIDISPLRRANRNEDAQACHEAIHRACLGTGFFVATGHGLDSEIEALFIASHRFFDLPQVDKEQIPRIDRYGYIPHASTAIDTDRQSTNTEYLDVGLASEIPLPQLDGFESAVRSYQAQALDVAAMILRSFSIALGVDEDFFATSMVDPQCRLRFLHYPPVQPGPDGRPPIPLRPHTDYGLITLLAGDGVSGLEVQGLDGDWAPIDAPPGTLVVNLGDMLARWTNDRYQSTPHRVVGPRSGDRYSIPFFINPDPATVLECIPTCVTEQNPCHYAPVTAGEYLAMRIDGASEPYVDNK